MPVVNVADQRKAIQYTGNNSGEIDAAITSFTINSEVGGVLDFTSGGDWVANTGDWLLFTQGSVFNVLTPSNFVFFYTIYAVPGDLATIESRLDDVESALEDVGDAALRSAGVASAPTLLVGTPANVAVQLVPAMPDTSYTPSAYLFGTGVNLGQVAINSVTVTAADTVTVQVQTSLLSLPGVHVLVVAKD